MADRSGYWIKLKETTEELFYEDQDAFILMTQIMFRVRKPKSKYSRNKLHPGQALIGDYASIGMSERRYRDAKDRIQNNYKLATFKGTSKGTIATLTNSEFCDINIEIKDEQKDEPRTDGGRTKDEPRTTNKEQEEAYASKEEQQQEQESEEIVVGDSLFTEKKEGDKIMPIYAGWRLETNPQDTQKGTDITYIIRRTVDEAEHFLKTFGFSDIDLNWLRENATLERANLAIKHVQCSKEGSIDKPVAFIKWHVKQAKIPELPKAKLTPKEKIQKYFNHGDIHNGAECIINEECIAFQRGMNIDQVKFEAWDFNEKIRNLLNRFQIEIPDEFIKQQQQKTG